LKQKKKSKKLTDPEQSSANKTKSKKTKSKVDSKSEAIVTKETVAVIKPEKEESVEERAKKLELKQIQESKKRKALDSADHKKLIDNIIKWIKDEKGEDIVNLDVSEKCNWTNNFIIATGKTNTHIRAIAKNIIANVGGNYEIEGNNDDYWQAIDLGSVVIHIFDKDTRVHYSLQDLWEKGPTLVEQNKIDMLNIDKIDLEDEDEDEIESEDTTQKGSKLETTAKKN